MSRDDRGMPTLSKDLTSCGGEYSRGRAIEEEDEISLTFDLRLRHGIQALDIHRLFAAGSPGSPPARGASKFGDEDDEPGSALGRICLGDSFELEPMFLKDAARRSSVSAVLLPVTGRWLFVDMRANPAGRDRVWGRSAIIVFVAEGFCVQIAIHISSGKYSNW